MPDEMSLPDAPAAFETKDSWKTRSNSALGVLDPRRFFREAEIVQMDRDVANHAKEHARLTEQYNEHRENYLEASRRYMEAPERSEEALNELIQAKAAIAGAAATYEKLVGSRQRIHQKFERWMDERRFGPTQVANGTTRVGLEGRNLHGALSDRRVHIPGEMRRIADDQRALGGVMERIGRQVDREAAQLVAARKRSATVADSRRWQGRPPNRVSVAGSVLEFADAATMRAARVSHAAAMSQSQSNPSNRSNAEHSRGSESSSSKVQEVTSAAVPTSSSIADEQRLSQTPPHIPAPRPSRNTFGPSDMRELNDALTQAWAARRESMTSIDSRDSDEVASVRTVDSRRSSVDSYRPPVSSQNQEHRQSLQPPLSPKAQGPHR